MFLDIDFKWSWFQKKKQEFFLFGSWLWKTFVLCVCVCFHMKHVILRHWPLQRPVNGFFIMGVPKMRQTLPAWRDMYFLQLRLIWVQPVLPLWVKYDFFFNYQHVLPFWVIFFNYHFHPFTGWRSAKIVMSYKFMNFKLIFVSWFEIAMFKKIIVYLMHGALKIIS